MFGFHWYTIFELTTQNYGSFFQIKLSSENELKPEEHLESVIKNKPNSELCSEIFILKLS